jgi:hypothetical protein
MVVQWLIQKEQVSQALDNIIQILVESGLNQLEEELARAKELILMAKVPKIGLVPDNIIQIKPNSQEDFHLEQVKDLKSVHQKKMFRVLEITIQPQTTLTPTSLVFLFLVVSLKKVDHFQNQTSLGPVITQTHSKNQMLA